MSTGVYIGVDGKARKVKSIYVGVDGVARKVKKIYIGDANGKARLCYSASSPAESATITYTGNMTDQIVTMTDGQYRLLTLTSSGTLTLSKALNAEVWMCNGGNRGDDGGDGGGGGYVASQSIALATSTTAVVGSGGTTGYGGQTSFGSITPTTQSSSGHIIKGASGGGSSYAGGGSSSGEGKSTYPFGDTLFFVNKPHSAGGGGGGYRWDDYTTGYSTTADGGGGGSNGGNGYSYSENDQGYFDGGWGGTKGGGDGGVADESGYNATFYGSGGGGGGTCGEDSVDESSNTVSWGDEYYGGNGYQGVIYVRIPIELEEDSLFTFGVHTNNSSSSSVNYFICKKGMTWEEFCSSPFNTTDYVGRNKFSITTYNGQPAIKVYADNVYVALSKVAVKPTDEILKTTYLPIVVG